VTKTVRREFCPGAIRLQSGHAWVNPSAAREFRLLR